MNLNLVYRSIFLFMTIFEWFTGCKCNVPFRTVSWRWTMLTILYHFKFQHKIAFPDNWTDERQLESQTMQASHQAGCPDPDRHQPATSQDQDPITYQAPEQQNFEQTELVFPDQSSYSSQQNMSYTLEGQIGRQGYQPIQIFPNLPRQNIPEQEGTSMLIPSQQYLAQPYFPTVRLTQTPHPQYGHRQAQDSVTPHTCPRDSYSPQLQEHGFQPNFPVVTSIALTGQHAGQFHRAFEAPVRVTQEVLNHTRFQPRQIIPHNWQDHPVYPAPLPHQTSAGREQSQLVRPSSSQTQSQPTKHSQHEGQFTHSPTFCTPWKSTICIYISFKNAFSKHSRSS